MNYHDILVETQGRVGVIRLNRPQRMNALNDALAAELAVALAAFDADPGIGAIIITGNEKAFAAGADIGAMADWSYQKVYADNYITSWESVKHTRKPVIAAVAGYALGGGCELAMACHLRIASDAAKFGQPEVKLGIAPGYGGTQRLPRLVGKGNALRLILTGDMIDAQEAYRIGLVNQVVPAGDLLATAEKTLRGILAMGPLAVRLALEAVDQGLEMTLDEGLLLEANHFGLLAATEDMKEGLAAFLEKRPPRFRGR